MNYLKKLYTGFQHAPEISGGPGNLLEFELQNLTLTF